MPLMPRPAKGDGPGFTPIFDGKSLSGWRGDPTYWRVEDGMIAEHWEVIQDVPTESPNPTTMFEDGH